MFREPVGAMLVVLLSRDERARRLWRPRPLGHAAPRRPRRVLGFVRARDRERVSDGQDGRQTRAQPRVKVWQERIAARDENVLIAKDRERETYQSSRE